jgi:surface antigen
MTRKIAKFATVIAVSAGLVAASAGPGRAGDLDPLFGGLIGGGIGAGVGYAAGKSKGAAIGGILGLGLGALIAAAADQDDHRRYPRHVAYAPPPPAYAPAPVYVPAPYDPAYRPGAYRQPYPPAPVYSQPDPYAGAQYSQAYCRQYNGTVNVNGGRYPSYGTACLQPDGTWRIVN